MRRRSSVRLVNIFAVEHARSSSTAPSPDLEVKQLRPYQCEALLALKEARFWILNQPPGSGKSLLTMVLCYRYLLAHPDAIVIIVVPQTIIGEAFIDESFEIPGEPGLTIHWQPKRYLLNEVGDESQSKTAGLLAALRVSRNQHSDWNERVVICSYLTLLRAMAHPGASELFQNLLLVVDEAHHCQIDSGDALADHTNQIGSLVRRAITEPDRNVHLGLTTATPYRGDCANIIGTHRHKFAAYTMDFGQYFESCQYLRRLVYNFALYQGDDYSGVIDEVLRQRRKAKLIIYLPAVNSGCSLGTKQLDLAAVWRGISGSEDPIKEEDGVVTRVKRGKRWLTYVDLVSTNCNREAKKKYIDQVHKEKRGSKKYPLDGIICLGMFHEGANWRQSDTAIILGPRYSLTDRVQMIGRILRDFRGKENAVVYHALPSQQEGQSQQYRDNNIKELWGAMVLEELYNPVHLYGAGGHSREVRTSRLLDLFQGDGAVVEEVITEVIKQHTLGRNAVTLLPKIGLKDIISTVLRERLGELVAAADIAVVYDQFVRKFARHDPRHDDQLLLLTSTEEIESELFRDGVVPGVFTAETIRIYRADLLAQRHQRIERLLDRLDQYIKGRGQKAYSIEDPHLLLVQPWYVTDDGYRLGDEVATVRSGRLVPNESQHARLEAMGFDFSPLRLSKISEAVVASTFVLANLTMLEALPNPQLKQYPREIYRKVCCSRGHHFIATYGAVRQSLRSGKPCCPDCRKELWSGGP